MARPDLTSDFGLIIVGDEILSGKRADKHLPKVIELLNARGLQLAYADYVGDDPERITATLKRAFASNDVVFCCGGIGATPDDHTRQCAAIALGRQLVLHPQAAALIRERMQDLALEQGRPYEADRPDNLHRLNMGMFPTGARLIPNPYNKISGFFCSREPQGGQCSAGPPQGALAPSGGSDPQALGERGGGQFSAGPPQGALAPSGGSDPQALGERGGGQFSAGPPQEKSVPSEGSDPQAVGERGGTLYFVPGFPVMAWPMIEWVLDTHYPALFRIAAWIEQSVIVFGAMESTLTPLMEALERDYAGVRVFSLPSVDHALYGRHIELGVKGEPMLVALAFAALLAGLHTFGVKLGPELVRK